VILVNFGGRKGKGKGGGTEDEPEGQERTTNADREYEKVKTIMASKPGCIDYWGS
jgi:hypothetical protein